MRLRERELESTMWTRREHTAGKLNASIQSACEAAPMGRRTDWIQGFGAVRRQAT